jgi:SAM-dependent methyltransferase
MMLWKRRSIQDPIERSSAVGAALSCGTFFRLNRRLLAMKVHYSKEFYDIQLESRRSAEAVISILRERYDPSSIVDIGCGVGVWLKEFQRLGKEDILGIDGPSLPADLLLIPRDKFVCLDVEYAAIDSVQRRFDLAICLEMAEHISPERAQVLIDGLSRLSDVVLFSAAIPYQGGTGHVNENWIEYWAGLFLKNDYVPVDLFRARLWSNPQVAFYYRQNALLFVRREKALTVFGVTGQLPVHSYVHPETYIAASLATLAKLGKYEDDVSYFNSLSQPKAPLGGSYKYYDDVQYDRVIWRTPLRVMKAIARSLFKRGR